MLDFESLAKLVDSRGYRPLFVTVSGAHLYGFPSPDSDIDLRGSHLLPLEEVVGLHPPPGTLEEKLDHHGREVELVSHDLGKYLRLLVRNNGYVLEQICSPLVVMGGEFLARLRPLAAQCITRHVYHHYRGFLNTQLRQLAREEPKRVKTVLYAYRVLLTGIHLLRTGEVEANLLRLAQGFPLDFLAGLVAEKQAGELAPATGFDWTFHQQKLSELEAELDSAHRASLLPDRLPSSEVNRFLVRERLAARSD